MYLVRDVVTAGISLMTQQRLVSKILDVNFHLGILLAHWVPGSDDGNNSREIYLVISSGTPKPKVGGWSEKFYELRFLSDIFSLLWIIVINGGLMEFVQTQMWCF